MNTLSDKALLKKELEGIRGLLALLLPLAVNAERSLKRMETPDLVYKPAIVDTNTSASPTLELSFIQRDQSSSVKS